MVFVCGLCFCDVDGVVVGVVVDGDLYLFCC